MSERIFTSGLLSKDATFRLIVSGGTVEARDIEHIIAHLKLDFEMLSKTATPETGIESENISTQTNPQNVNE